MSWFNRIRNVTNRLASDALPGARRLASNITESARRRVTNFGNWLTDYVGSEQTLQVLREIAEHVRSNYPPIQSFEVRESESALREFARVYTINGTEGYDARSFLYDARENIMSVLHNNRRTKVKLILKCYMKKTDTDGELIIQPFAFHSNIEENLEGTDEDNLYVTMTERILENIAALLATTSEWRLHSIIKLELHTVSYNPLRGETWIALPKELANKKAIINMKNEDNKCFLWCVLRALNPKDNHSEIIDKKLKEKENTLNMEEIEYPVSLKDIDKFERQNPSISITVFGYKEKGVYPLRNSDNINREHDIVLALIEKDGVLHYCLVKNVSRLLSSQVSNHKEKHHFCLRCLNSFWTHTSLNKHWEYCGKHEAVKINMPKEGTMLKFKNYHRGEKVPFVIYADFESCIKSIHTCDLNPESSYTKQYQKHEPISFYYYIKCFNDKVYLPIKERSYTGKNAEQVFLKCLGEDIKMIANIPTKNMIFGKKEEKQYEKETRCWICKGEFDDKDEN